MSDRARHAFIDTAMSIVLRPNGAGIGMELEAMSKSDDQVDLSRLWDEYGQLHARQVAHDRDTKRRLAKLERDQRQAHLDDAHHSADLSRVRADLQGLRATLSAVIPFLMQQALVGKAVYETVRKLHPARLRQNVKLTMLAAGKDQNGNNLNRKS